MTPEQKRIFMCTTDKIPGPAGNYEVNRVSVTWSTDHANMRAAHDALEAWALQNNFDAVVGIRIEPHPAGSYTAPYSTGLRWAIYGTAIGW
jgi:hypothetical protein